MKTVFTYAIIMITIMSFQFCSTKKNVKEQPAIGKWEKCSLCNGTGFVKICDSKGSADDIHNRDNGNDSCMGRLLECFALIIVGDYESDDTRKSIYGSEKCNGRSYETDMKDEIPERSVVKKYVKCPRCNGVGWIEKRFEIRQSVDSEHHKYERLRELHEEINR